MEEPENKVLMQDSREENNTNIDILDSYFMDPKDYDKLRKKCKEIIITIDDIKH